jgi:hypothetical protein
MFVRTFGPKMKTSFYVVGFTHSVGVGVVGISISCKTNVVSQSKEKCNSTSHAQSLKG